MFACSVNSYKRYFFPISNLFTFSPLLALPKKVGLELSIVSKASGPPRAPQKVKADVKLVKAKAKADERARPSEELEEPPMLQAFFTYLCYTVLRWFGNLRELLRSVGVERRKGAKDNNSKVSRRSHLKNKLKKIKKKKKIIRLYRFFWSDFMHV